MCRLIQRVEAILMASGKFRLPGKKQLHQDAERWEILVVDVTESPPRRAQKKNSELTTAAKNGDTRSIAQVVVQATGQIVCTAFGKGRVHDFRLFKQHRLPMLPEQLCLADKGYQGLAIVASS